MTKRATMRDVAVASGVSPTTVSFVLNDAVGRRVSAATRARVERVAHDLGYVPHGIARALREGSSRVVLLDLDPAFRGGSIDGYIRGLEEELAAHGFALLVRHGTGSRRPLAPVVEAVVPRAVVDLSDLYEPGTGAADDGGWVHGLAAHTQVQLRHLADAGHERIAVALPEGGEQGRLARARLGYARQAAAALDLPELEVLAVPRDPASATRAVAALLADHPGLTAVAAFDDVLALRLLAVLRGLARAVPDDLAVIGFDATEHGAYSDPPLTSVDIDAESFGRRAARTALGLAADEVSLPRARVVGRGSA